MTPIPFTHFFSRVTEITPLATQTALAQALGVNRSAITQAKNRDAVPQKWVFILARQYGLCPDWLASGTGSAREIPVAHRPKPASVLEAVTGKRLPSQRRATPQPEAPMVVQVPEVHARLCAGGGSLEVASSVREQHSLPYAWLSKMGTPAAMVFMQVTGDSMEPTIFDGDSVLIDQSATRIEQKKIYAVGHEESIYIKRVVTAPHQITLLSDNKTHSPITVSGDELHSFRVLGSVVWLCRDCRFL